MGKELFAPSGWLRSSRLPFPLSSALFLKHTLYRPRNHNGKALGVRGHGPSDRLGDRARTKV